MSELPATTNEQDSPNKVTPPEIKSPVIQEPKPAIDAVETASASDLNAPINSREPLNPAKHHDEAEADQSMVDKTEAVIKELNPTQSVTPTTTTLPAKNPLVVEADTFQQAEHHFASYIGRTLKMVDERLIHDLHVSLIDAINSTELGKNDVTIRFSGSAMIGSNAGLLSAVISESVKKHPAFAPLLKAGHPLTVDEVTTEMHGTSLNVRIQGVGAEHYAQFVHALASGPIMATVPTVSPKVSESKPAKDIHHEEVSSTLGHGSTQLPEGMTVLGADAPSKPHEPAPKDEAPVADALAKVEAPVIHMGRQEQKEQVRSA